MHPEHAVSRARLRIFLPREERHRGHSCPRLEALKTDEISKSSEGSKNSSNTAKAARIVQTHPCWSARLTLDERTRRPVFGLRPGVDAIARGGVKWSRVASPVLGMATSPSAPW